MAISRREREDHGEADDFSRFLHQGSSLLGAGKLAEAREALEQAHRLQPKNQKAQGQLAVTCFKLGEYERAAELYELLVRENPVEAPLRVNLGLVYLKMGALQRAIKELETSVDLAPEHKKAQNYLGLALAQVREYARAKEAFAAAGSAGMVEKMERALAGQAEQAEVAQDVVPDVSGAAKKDFTEIDGGEAEARAVPSSPAAHPASQGAALQAGEASAAVPGAFLTDLAQALKVMPGQATPFQAHGSMVGVRVSGEVFTRLENLIALLGPVTVQPEVKRFRGRATDKPFGKGSRRFVRASGQGLVWVSAAGKVFLPVDLAEGAAYFTEEAVFAFEESLTFENGRLPAKDVPDLHLVHLRGAGRVLLALPGPLRSVEISQAFPALVAVEHLVGWLGSLTPKIVPEVPAGEGEARPAVELTGEGFALFCLSEPK